MNSPVLTSPSFPGCLAPAGIQPGCEPFTRLNGHDRAIVFLHGLTGTPADYRRFTETHAARFDVIAPLLPGHATRMDDLDRLTYRDLTAFMPPLMDELRGRYRELHLCGLSYGAVPAAEWALAGGVRSLTLFAPALFLREKNERSMRWVRRLRLDLLRKRVAKSHIHPSRKRGNEPDETFAYPDIPVRPAMELHRRAEYVRAALAKATIPLFYAHGDRDTTTPLETNRDFVMRVRPDAHFYLVEGGEHVITLGPGAADLAAAHAAWLEEISA